MAYSEETQLYAELLYCLQRIEIPEISERTGVSESTLRRWRAELGWEDKRVARALSGPMMAYQITMQIHEIMEHARAEGRPMTPGESDQCLKLKQMAEKYDPDGVFVSHALDAMDEFNTFIAEEYPELHDDVKEPIVEFSRDIVERRAE